MIFIIYIHFGLPLSADLAVDGNESNNTVFQFRPNLGRRQP